MTLEEANKLKDLMEADGLECSIRDDYSGRGMYGETTVGLVVRDYPQSALAIMVESTMDCQYDGMGLGIVFY